MWKETGLYKGVRTFHKNGKLLDLSLQYYDIFNKTNYNYRKPFQGVTTGYLCIVDCLQYKPSQVSIYGFDCFTSGDRYCNSWDVVNQYVETEKIRLKILIDQKLIVPDKLLLSIYEDEKWLQ